VPDLAAARGRDSGGALVLPLDGTPGHLIRRAQQRHTVLWNREFDGTITGPQYAVICAVGGDGGLDQREVGRRASLDKSSTADIVARLEELSWLRFGKDVADGRRKSLRLTPLARTALREVTRRAGLVQERLLAPLGPEAVPAFLAALQLVAHAGTPPVAGSAEEGFLLLGSTPGHLVRRAQQRHTVAWNEEVGRTLTAPQYAVLSVLGAHPEGVDQSTVGELASLDKSSTTDIVARLAKRGWVARTRDPADARRRLLSLTDVVRDDLPELTPAVRRVQERLLRPLLSNAERAAFLDGLTALAFDGDVPPNA
jgi:DNA-binding MarR family transcriptional regulator